MQRGRRLQQVNLFSSAALLLRCAPLRLSSIRQASTEAVKPSVVFVLGGPGSGKGTVSNRASQGFNFLHISAGELLRNEIKSGSEQGAEIARIINYGRIVPSEITVGLLDKVMIDHRYSHNRFMIDGFPRNLENWRAWDSQLGTKVDVGCVLFLECSEKEMEERLLRRGETSGREDDTLSVIRKRFEIFKRETMPVASVFDQQGKLRKINGSKDPSNVYKEVQEVLGKLYKQEG